MGVLSDKLARWGVLLQDPSMLFWASALLSNLVSNVPAVMLLLPSAPHPASGPILAVSSTLAGKLLVVGSIANIIVLEQAGRLGVAISAKAHVPVGVPVTVLTLVLAYLWLLAIS